MKTVVLASETILVWPYKAAPERFQEKSEGDWVVFVPSCMIGMELPWLHNFVYTESYPVKGGYVVIASDSPGEETGELQRHLDALLPGEGEEVNEWDDLHLSR